MPQFGFEPAIPAGERPKTYTLDRAATGTGSNHFSTSDKLKITAALHRKTKGKTYSEAGNIALRQTLWQ
jgi:hypothetical protein